MSYESFMNKLRHLDSLAAKWMMRHFYFMFFQIVLAAIFILWFINITSVIDTSFQITKDDIIGKMLMAQSINLSIIVLLLILSSFWLLYIFNTIQRQTNILKDLNFNMTRRIKDR